MAIGPGKYDKPCMLVREMTHAEGVVLVVINGDRGCGLSMQASLHAQWMLPDILEMMAKQIRAGLASELPTPGTPTQ